jgi:hypothetical protein
MKKCTGILPSLVSCIIELDQMEKQLLSRKATETTLARWAQIMRAKNQILEIAAEFDISPSDLVSSGRDMSAACNRN